MRVLWDELRVVALGPGTGSTPPRSFGEQDAADLAAPDRDALGSQGLAQRVQRPVRLSTCPAWRPRFRRTAGSTGPGGCRVRAIVTIRLRSSRSTGGDDPFPDGHPARRYRWC